MFPLKLLFKANREWECFKKCLFVYYSYSIHWEFFMSALADDLSLEFEWQQVSSSLQNSSQYSGRCRQCCGLDGIHSSSYFQVTQSNLLVIVLRAPITNGINFHVPQLFFFQFISKVYILILLFSFFQFYSVISQDSKVHSSADSLIFCWLYIRFRRLAKIRWSGCISIISEEFACFFLQNSFWVLHITFVCMVRLKFLAQFPVGHLSNPVVPSCITLFVLICCIQLCDWSFRLYHHLTYICCFVGSYQFFLWYEWSLWRCFVLLFGEILFLW